MRMNAIRKDKVNIGNEEVEDVEEFVCLGATVSKVVEARETSRNVKTRHQELFST